MRRTIVAAAAALFLAATANAAEINAPQGFKKVSGLVPLPDFIPGLGTLYVNPETLPVGPFLAYDRAGQLVSTIYMVLLDDMEAHKRFAGLDVGSTTVTKTDLQYNAGHPGVEQPHYHITLWHVSPDEAKLAAK